jgi:hypothetical protein
MHQTGRAGSVTAAAVPAASTFRRQSFQVPLIVYGTYLLLGR